MESEDSQRGRRPASQNMISIVLAVAFLLVLCGVAAGAGTLLSSHAVPGPSTGVNSPARGASRAKIHAPRQSLPLLRGHHSPAPTWVWLILLGAVLTVAIAVAVVMLRGRLAPSGETEPAEAEDFSPTAEREALQAGVAAALADLDEEAHPREGVVACWLRLEGSLQELHAGRAPAETSAELARRVLGVYDVDPETLNGLQRTYQIARFSQETVTEAMRDRARSALQVVSRQLGHTRTHSDPPTMSPAGL